MIRAMADQEERRALSYPVTAAAREGFRQYALAHRVSAAALTEALGLALGQLDGRASTPWLRGVVTEAQRITDERHWSTRE
jgi:hypothetical protein